MPDRMPDRMPEDMSDRMPEDMPDRMPEDLPDRMPEDRMPEDMLDRMPNRMSEDMSDRMPEDLPVRKCINVMVGITRSKVICFRGDFTKPFPIGEMAGSHVKKLGDMMMIGSFDKLGMAKSRNGADGADGFPTVPKSWGYLQVSFIELDDGKIYRKALYLVVKTMVSG